MVKLIIDYYFRQDFSNMEMGGNMLKYRAAWLIKN